MRSELAALTGGAAALCLILVACGGDDVETSPGSSVTAATDEAGAAGDFNDADVSFAQGMIPHHEQAIEMVDLAIDPASGTGPEVLDLATRIKAAQHPEIELMTGWLTTWGEPVEMHTGDGHDMAAIAGMMSAEDMEVLAAATGADFDRMWMEMMVAHHEGAITQAETVLADGSNTDVLALAEQIIAAQQREIDEMQGLLEGPPASGVRAVEDPMFPSLRDLNEALSCGGRASISLDAFVSADDEATFDDVDELRDQTATLLATYHGIDTDPEALRTALATSSGRYWFGRHRADDESGETLDLIVSLARDATTGRPVVEHLQACRAALRSRSGGGL